MARPDLMVPDDMWDALVLCADMVGKRPNQIICEQIAYFLINDWEEVTFTGATERAAEAQAAALKYLESHHD